MAVAVRIDCPGWTLDDYDKVHDEMGFTRGGAGAPGCLFHWVAANDGGICVQDVWVGMDAFQEFATASIGPIAEKFGLTPPEITFTEVHNYLTG